MRCCAATGINADHSAAICGASIARPRPLAARGPCRSSSSSPFHKAFPHDGPTAPKGRKHAFDTYHRTRTVREKPARVPRARWPSALALPAPTHLFLNKGPPKLPKRRRRMTEKRSSRRGDPRSHPHRARIHTTRMIQRNSPSEGGGIRFARQAEALVVPDLVAGGLGLRHGGRHHWRRDLFPH